MEDMLFTKNVSITPSMTEKEIFTKSKDVDPKAISKEIIQWMIDNVENYVDNHRTVYRLYLTVDSNTVMAATGLLQLLYMSIPSPKDDNDQAAKDVEGRCLDLLDDLTIKVKEELVANKEGLKSLYDRLVYYYEMTGFSSQSGPIVQQFDGYVELSEFVYEPLSMEVVVSSGEDIVDSSGNHIGQNKPKAVVKREMLPEGYAVELEIKYWKKPLPSMF